MSEPPLPPKFYMHPVVKLAEALLGQLLVTEVRGQRTSGRIVEVEAYSGDTDPAAHSFRGMTKRTAVMFQSAGHCYVYFVYGNHFCVNVVADAEGVGHAVLIRALEPYEGIHIMKRRRATDKEMNLVSGPGKLCKALGIDLKFNGEYLPTSRRIWIEPHGAPLRRSQLVSGPRIGISKARDIAHRFYLKDSPWVSRAPKRVTPA